MNRYLRFLNTSQREKVKFITKHPKVIIRDSEGNMFEAEFKNAYLVVLNPGYEFGDELHKTGGTAKLATSIKEIKFYLENNVIKKGSE